MRKSTEMENAEKRYQSLIEKRDEQNKLSDAVKKERDTLNETKHRMIEEIKNLKNKRDTMVKEMREHKRKRESYQKEAKSLLELKRSESGKMKKNLPGSVGILRKEVEDMEMRQQTVPLSLSEEKKIVERIRQGRIELKKMEESLKTQEETITNIENVNTRIQTLFSIAEEEHRNVMKLYQESQVIHEKIMSMVNEVSHINNEANKKHLLYLSYRKKAEEYHTKAREMREKILTMKQEQWSEMKEAKKIIQEQNISVSKVLNDREMIDKKMEEDLNKLMKKKKLTF